tara:strand:- start:432 stop:599 length:168 start_codon:yes stop_codon:yes gene_type:complete
MILYGIYAFISTIFLKGVYDAYLDLQQHIREEELKQRQFNMNMRWSIKNHAEGLS